MLPIEKPEQGELSVPGEVANSGPLELSFEDLSLEDVDVDYMLDFLLFPEEFEEDEKFEFPPRIQALDGKTVSITGYMIPGKIERNHVGDFMLVRDLLACCFGGSPNPDEWIDVRMAGDLKAEYLRFIPVKVRGKLSLAGEQDNEGYAVGVYRMEATQTAEED